MVVERKDSLSVQQVSCVKVDVNLKLSDVVERLLMGFGGGSLKRVLELPGINNWLARLGAVSAWIR